MKKLLFLLLASALNAQPWGSSESTTPVGVTNIPLPGGTVESPSYTFLSSAYMQDPAYAGMVDAINESTLTLIDFDENGYEDHELTQAGHLLRITDGNGDGNADLFSTVNGLIFPVVDNVGNDITINLPPDQVSTYFALYDSVEIIQANTLGSLFGTGDDFVGLTGKPASGDNLIIWSSVGWKVYFHYQNKWQTFGTRNDQKNTIIYPDEGMVYARKSDALTLSFSGNVALSIHSYRPGSGGKFLMSNPFPITMTLSQLIDPSSNWISGTILNEVDQVLFWSGSAWVTYYHNGTDWINLMESTIDDRSIESAGSFFILRANNPSLSEAYYKLDIPE